MTLEHACRRFLDRVSNASSRACFNTEARKLIMDSVDEIQEALNEKPTVTNELRELALHRNNQRNLRGV